MIKKINRQLGYSEYSLHLFEVKNIVVYKKEVEKNAGNIGKNKEQVRKNTMDIASNRVDIDANNVKIGEIPGEIKEHIKGKSTK